ncbi:MAG: Tetratricopeptide 2 repeat protein [Chthoniobacter sp.]|nr:Tetratricopeptide 2 repeat protein [Chthoniobacter sp.]
MLARKTLRIIVSLKKLPRTVAVVVIIAATFLVYWPALRNGFVWDDTALVLRDPLIRSWRLIPEGFRHFLFLDATASDFYRPLQRLSFTADYALFGFGFPAGWHFTSIALHAAAAVALFWLGEKLLTPVGGAVNPRHRWAAAAAALIWAIHPIYTSAVTYVAGRADLLMALFAFSGLALAIKSLDPHRRQWRFAAGATACFLAAALSKESGLTVLLVWLLVLGMRRVPLRIFGTWAVVLALVLGCYLGLRLTAERTPPPAPPATPLAIRPILAARAVAEYAGLVLYPRILRMERDVTTVPQGSYEATMQNARRREYQTLGGVLLIVALGTWFLRARRNAMPIALCLAAAGLTYLPTSNLLSLNATVAEHWLYLPGAFLALAAVGAVERSAVIRKPVFRQIGGTVLAIWVGYLGVRTWQRQADWKDQRTFLERTIADGGDTARMHINLGNLESSAGRHAAALQHFQTAVAKEPTQAIGWLGLANATLRTRDFTASREALEQARSSPLLRAEVLQTRAVLEHLETGRDTVDLLHAALTADPRNWSIRKRYLQHLDERGQTATAAQELHTFLKIQPFRADSWRLLGELLEKLNQPSAAAAAYRHAAIRDVRDEHSRTRLKVLGS